MSNASYDLVYLVFLMNHCKKKITCSIKNIPLKVLFIFSKQKKNIFIHLSAILSKIGSLECVCNQIVVAMETQFAEETAQLFSSLEEIQLEVNVIHNQQNEGQNCFLLP